MVKCTAIITKNDNMEEFNLQVPGWKTETQMEGLLAKHGKGGYIFRDYVWGYEGEPISHQIHKRIR